MAPGDNDTDDQSNLSFEPTASETPDAEPQPGTRVDPIVEQGWLWRPRPRPHGRARGSTILLMAMWIAVLLLYLQMRPGG